MKYLDHLKNLLPGDIVLADHGFNVTAGFYCASLQMPAFNCTRKIANVHIHVERIIGLVRRKCQILQSRAAKGRIAAKFPAWK